jgi:hypothetical protein
LHLNGLLPSYGAIGAAVAVDAIDSANAHRTTAKTDLEILVRPTKTLP